jgi:hypothetical protein
MPYLGYQLLTNRIIGYPDAHCFLFRMYQQFWNLFGSRYDKRIRAGNKPLDELKIMIAETGKCSNTRQRIA